MARKKKSNDFAAWVRTNRIEIGKSQIAAADEAGLSQQEWSKIERHGIVPDDDRLKSICRALGRPMYEASRLIAGATRDDRSQRYELEVRSFEEKVVYLAKQCERVDIYIVREDREPSGVTAAEQHYELFRKATNLHVTVLFRYSDSKVWHSFISLARDLEGFCNRKSDGVSPRDQLHGYHRHPKHEESGSDVLPMGPPLVLVATSKGRELWSYDYDPETFRRQKAEGFEDDIAMQRSIVVSQCWPDKAILLREWIHIEFNGDLSREFWMPIPWPD